MEDKTAKPFWICQEGGYQDHVKPMPKDREAFYKKVHEKGIAPKCPKCKSEAFMPSGF